MFDAPELNNHLLTETTVRTQPKVFAEINLNDPNNIRRIGVIALWGKYGDTDRLTCTIW